MDGGELITKSVRFIKEHKTWILTGITVCGVGATAFLTGKAVLKADRYLRENVDPEILEVMPTIDKARNTWTYYIPPVATGAATIATALMAQQINVGDIASMAMLAANAKEKLIENRADTQQVFGDKGLRKVDAEINEQRFNKYACGRDVRIYDTGHGSMLCCEGYLTGIMFRASPEWIRRGINRINAYLNEGEAKSYADLICEWIPDIHPRQLSVKANRMGWDPSKMAEDGVRIQIDIACDTFLTDEGEACMIFTMIEEPMEDYLYYK